MKIKVSDYIADFLDKNGINTLFSITGGFAMHLNDSFGNNKNLNIYYQHHEQACGYSAIGFTKSYNKISGVCITAGCAATNAISPCLVAFQDSVPILFISGQTKSTEVTRVLNKENMKLRHYSGQDCDIISMVKPITKYAYEITKLEELDCVLENIIFNLLNGRPGPVWLSMPIDIQSMYIERNTIEPNTIEPNKLHELYVNNINYDTNSINLKVLYEYLKQSARPVIIAGNGITLSNCRKKFNNFLIKYKIPVVVSFHGTDLINFENDLYCGKIGLVGDRAGNFVLQNADLIISFGCRMAQGVVGYNTTTFAREAKVIYIDIDQNELDKNNINYELKINMDLNVLFEGYSYEQIDYSEWIKKCNHWKKKWAFELPYDYLNDTKGINPYYALYRFFEISPGNKNILCSSGSIVTCIWHMIKIKENDRFIISSQGDMGFELPASIGSYIADPNKMIIPIFGEGSLQLNIQELQTIVHHKFPIKMLIFNNNSYGANVITQNLYFKSKYGSDIESDLSFPNTEKIANAYGIEYMSIKHNSDLDNVLHAFLESKTSIICEIFCSIQQRCPKLSAVKNDDGTFTSKPYEDMDPFMSRDEFKNEMIIKPLE